MSAFASFAFLIDIFRFMKRLNQAVGIRVLNAFGRLQIIDLTWQLTRPFMQHTVVYHFSTTQREKWMKKFLNLHKVPINNGILDVASQMWNLFGGKKLQLKIVLDVSSKGSTCTNPTFKLKNGYLHPCQSIENITCHVLNEFTHRLYIKKPN